MHYDPKIHHRRSIRLSEFDYSQPGAYFVTLVVKNRSGLLGEIRDEQVRLSSIGRIVEKWWTKVPAHFPDIACEFFVIMPNHFHGIVEIDKNTGPDCQDPKGEAAMLGKIVGYFKYQSTKEINQIRQTPGLPFWQRNYFEHIIRNEDDFRTIYEYIQTNPQRWAEDTLFPKEP